MGSNCVVDDIPKFFSAMRLEVGVSKLHIRSCAHHFKCFFGDEVHGEQ